jgi:prepilin peptidase CpaA
LEHTLLTPTGFFSLGALVLCTVAAGWDIATRRIPNPLTVAAMAGGLVGHLLLNQGAGLVWSAAGLLVGAALTLLSALYGGLGGGDVKLMAALGALCGPRATFEIALVSAIAGGLLALLMALRHRVAFKALRQAAALLSFRRTRAASCSSEIASGGTVPYAVAIGAATWICLFGGGPF